MKGTYIIPDIKIHRIKFQRIVKKDSTFQKIFRTNFNLQNMISIINEPVKILYLFNTNLSNKTYMHI
jgi:hypothetical protein